MLASVQFINRILAAFSLIPRGTFANLHGWASSQRSMYAVTSMRPEAVAGCLFTILFLPSTVPDSQQVLNKYLLDELLGDGGI